jgi:hypothetical protein
MVQSSGKSLRAITATLLAASHLEAPGDSRGSRHCQPSLLQVDPRPAYGCATAGPPDHRPAGISSESGSSTDRKARPITDRTSANRRCHRFRPHPKWSSKPGNLLTLCTVSFLIIRGRGRSCTCPTKAFPSHCVYA